jgi:hypothetical protein
LSRCAGLLALALVALDPNIIAHAGLATTDLGLAAGATLAGYTLWRFLRRPGMMTAILAGAAMGLLQNTKFTALLFVPLFGLVIALWLWNIACGWWQESGVGRRVLRANAGAKERRSRGENSGEWRVASGESALRHLQSAIRWLVVYSLVALFTLWATNGFQVGKLPEELPFLPQLAGMTVPSSHYFEQLLDISGRLQVSTPSFLAGRYSDEGWWYYFPVAFLLKTPLPTLALVLLAAVITISSRNRLGVANLQEDQKWLNTAMLLIPAAGYFMIALTSEINLGYRHLLPVLPFLYVWAAVSVAAVPGATALAGRNSPTPEVTEVNVPLSTNKGRKWLSWIVGLCLLSLGLATLNVYPHFLAFFNVLAGGPENGWRWLVDSNIDWGQDLGQLKEWMDDHNVDHIWLSYFGEARPEYYGISYTGLDSFPPRLMNPETRPFYPLDPAPGVYAISATNLQGVHFANHDQFAWFRSRKPVAHVGHSILIYEVPARGHPANLLLDGVQLDELDAADFALLGTNAIIPRWFDASQSWLIPDGDNVWLALGSQQTLHPALANKVSLEQVVEGSQYTLYRVDKAADDFRTWVERLPEQTPLAIFLGQAGGQITLLDHKILNSDLDHAEESMILLTLWRQESTPLPVKIFVHLRSPDGSIAGQHDGLGVAWEGWRQGDQLLQLHRLPAGLPPEEYNLVTGLYDPETLERWTAGEQDAVLLSRTKLPATSQEE